MSLLFVLSDAYLCSVHFAVESVRAGLLYPVCLSVSVIYPRLAVRFSLARSIDEIDRRAKPPPGAHFFQIFL